MPRNNRRHVARTAAGLYWQSRTEVARVSSVHLEAVMLAARSDYHIAHSLATVWMRALEGIDVTNLAANGPTAALPQWVLGNFVSLRESLSIRDGRLFVRQLNPPHWPRSRFTSSSNVHPHVRI